MVHLQALTAHDPLTPLRRWIDRFEPRSQPVARLLVRLIPGSCPFERDVTVLGRRVLHIPAMCKLNPLYDQVAALRFRCLCFLELDAGGQPLT
ncbi:Mo-dependent nitrogenase C-terminal domain-containing protein [Cyanobium sp. Morenito 9A2]|uniref:Mo-dependent nitrogenase C-terminal domain-containing protein n=1 Tax=Cyanobium sp. Morenito 9A2 TaxID=2823718 RepID=UPI0020CE9622|nr:Mo-dependent nitrogenase C-terminal domain-containing protein [Cyanobium sp. Morenito 9A2]MCP9851107.1 hypothetical protein [Cyanobium sp. Morenito 9A2]